LNYLFINYLLIINNCANNSIQLNLADDEQFNDEKAFLLKQIQEM